MELQIQTIGRTLCEERDQLAEDHSWTNKYFIWQEVDAAKRSKIDLGSRVI